MNGQEVVQLSVSRSGQQPNIIKMVLKGLKGKTLSSARWLQRQSHDYYVQQAKLHSFRSRAAFKLTQMHDKFSFLKHSILDLGASPGGWSQVNKT